MTLAHFSLPPPLRTVALLTVVVTTACTHTPKGFRVASRGEATLLSQWEARLAQTCPSEGSFLAELEPLHNGQKTLGFQMEGVWIREGTTFEAQFLSPLGEGWAQFQFSEPSDTAVERETSQQNEMRFGNTITAEQKEALSRFVQTLATLGPKNLRLLVCGHGLVRLQNARVYAPKNSQVNAQLTTQTWQVQGSIPIQGTSVSLETRVTLGSTPRMHALVTAGLWGTQRGSLAWEGRENEEGLMAPHRLIVQQNDKEGAELTFLEFE